MSNMLDVFLDREFVSKFGVVVPVWTQGEIGRDQLAGLVETIERGVGLAGCHGMCDAFRAATPYHFVTGGQWVAHPGDDEVEYTVRITDPSHYITVGMKNFSVVSEQYYLHVDPSNRVLATTQFPVVEGPHSPNGDFDMPVVWARRHGRGRVFYCSLGHTPELIEMPEVLRICTRGILWAARADTNGGR
jgi:type 1 glutamine amidotransferase